MAHKTRWFVSVLATVLAPALAWAQADAPSRGALLYANHCSACHGTQMHWRDARAATDWASLKAQVQRWQAAGQLAWSDADVDEVARHLNQRFYRYPMPTARL